MSPGRLNNRNPIAIPEPRENAHTRLLVCPHVGGSMISYLPLAPLLDPEIETAFLLLPARIPGSSHPWPCAWDEWSAHVTRALARDPRPIVLFGHSFGALNAIEIARALLREENRVVTHLFLSSLHPDRSVTASRRWSELPEIELHAVLEKLSGQSFRSWHRVSAETRRMILNTARADFAMVETAPPLAGGLSPGTSVSVFGGSEDPHVSVAELGGWRESLPSAEIKIFSGAHFWPFPTFSELGEAIRTRLN